MVSRLKNREKFSFMRETMESWNVGFRRNHRSLTLHPSNREVKAQTGFVPDSTLRSRWKFFFFPMKKEPGGRGEGAWEGVGIKYANVNRREKPVPCQVPNQPRAGAHRVKGADKLKACHLGGARPSHQALHNQARGSKKHLSWPGSSWNAVSNYFL